MGKMGSGTVYLMIAELAAIASNYLVHIGLARYLGKETYGIFGIIMSLYLINRAFLNTGVPRAVSKFLSETKANIPAVFQSSFRLQLILATLFAGLYIIFSKPLALILNDIALVPYILILGVMVIPLSILALYLSGYMNGLRMFKQQSIIKVVYPILRIIFTLILVLLGLKIYGAMFGYLLGTIVSVFIAKPMIKKIGKSKQVFSHWKILKFSVPLTIAALGLTFSRNINVLFIKAILSDNALAGLYTSAATLSNIPYLVFAALPLTLMPSISKSLSAANFKLTRKYINESMRYIFLFLAPITVMVSLTSSQLISLLYSSSYESGGPVLSVLIFSSTFLAIFAVLVAVITGSGKPKIEMYITLLLVIAITILNLALIPIFGILGAALASLYTSLLALTIAAAYVLIKFKALISFTSFTKIILATLIVFFVAFFWHYSGLFLLVNYLVYLIIYFIVLLCLGELKEDDLKLLTGLIKKSR
ncbi:MAG: oligosaccharide flippase family protein [Nanoarchaeota archaeon]|nr:oligosaccharide flippase family protein [Nanoarchaeota archaeon]